MRVSFCWAFSSHLFFFWIKKRCVTFAQFSCSNVLERHTLIWHWRYVFKAVSKHPIRIFICALLCLIDDIFALLHSSNDWYQVVISPHICPEPSTPNCLLCLTVGRTRTILKLTVVFSGELKMNPGEHFLTETHFCIYCGYGIGFLWMMCCRGFPKVKRLDRVQGGSNNSYFFCNLDGWKVSFILHWCFVLLFLFFSPQI